MRRVLVVVVLALTACARAWEDIPPRTTTVPSQVPIPGSTVDESGRLAELAINDRPYAGPAYRREDWPHWRDPDGDGCDAREQALRDASLDPPIIGPGCEVKAGRWSYVYVAGETTNPGALDVDHIIPLGLAQVSGADGWTTEQRTAFANDPLELVPVKASANRSKGDRSPAEWQPATAYGRCLTAQRTIAVSLKYHLSVTMASRDALGRMLRDCA